jgi:Molecular chaperone
VDKATNKEAKITITGASTLSEEEKRKAIEEAERQKEADRLKKELAEARNNADSIAYQAGKLIHDMGDKLSESDKEELTRMQKELEEMVKKDDITKEELDRKAQSLQERMMALGEKVYATQNQESQSGKPEDGVQDVKSS